MKRIVILGPTPPPYGGWAHEVVSLSKVKFPPPLQTMVIDTCLRKKRQISKLWEAGGTIVRCLREVHSAKPDLVVIFIGPGSSMWRDLVLVRRLQKAGIPLFVRFIGGVILERIESYPSAAKKVWVAALKKATGIAFETFEMASRSRRLAPSVPCYRVPNHVIESELPVPDIRESEPIRVLYLGNMTPLKGVDVVLEAAALIPADVDVEFDFVGGELEAGYLDIFRARASELKVTDRVRIHGAVKHEHVTEYLRKCNVFALPTRWPGEGQPGALIEAMGAGLCPMVTGWRGCGELVKDGVNGIVIDRDAQMLASRLTFLSRDPGRLADLRRNARETIIADYGTNAARTLYLRIFEETMGWKFEETPAVVN